MSYPCTVRAPAVVLIASLVGCPTVGDELPVADGFDNSITSLSCPEPGDLPFPTRSSDWGEDGSEDLLEDTRPAYGGFDLLGPISGGVQLEGTMGRGVEFDSEPFEDEWVSLWGWTEADGWVQHGREETESGSDGGEFAIEAGATALPSGDGAVYSILEGNGHCAAHGIYPWPEGTQVIIADIDGTMTRSDGELFAWFDDAEYVPREWPDASRLMQTWDAKGYRVVYLTGRPHSLRAMTLPWLDALDFPRGPLSTAVELLGSFQSVQYKAGFLRSIQDDLGWEIVAAYGNSPGDISGYAEGGVPKQVTFTIGPDAGTADTVSVGDRGWTAHIADFVEPFPDAN